VAVADISREARDAFSQDYGIPATYDDYRAMLEQEKPDIVSVCVWPHMHPEAAINSAMTSSVRGVLCEKPLGLTMAAMKDIITACDASNVRLGIGHQLRYQRRHEIARDLIRSGEIGEIERVWAVCASGDLMSNTIHTVDLMLMYCSDRKVTKLFAQVDPGEGGYRFGHPVERTAMAYGRIGADDGSPAVRFSVESANLWTAGYHYLAVEGTRGVIEVNRPDSPLVQIRRAGDNVAVSVPVDDEPDPSTAAALELCAAIEENRDPYSSGRTGYRSAELILAMYASAFRKQPVDLPLPVDLPSPLHQLFAWDGVVRGGRGAAFSTSGVATTEQKIR
jgi:predicted dehydrogenase